MKDQGVVDTMGDDMLEVMGIDTIPRYVPGWR